MSKVLIIYQDCVWYMNVCMLVCMPRVGSRQVSQNKLIWFTLLCYLLRSVDNITPFLMLQL